MGMQKKYRQARKQEYALRTGEYRSGSPAGFGVQNARMRLGYVQKDEKKLAKYKEAYK